MIGAHHQDFKAGERICGLDNVSLAQEKAYSSVQFGTNADDHFELNSDLLFSTYTPILYSKAMLMNSEPLLRPQRLRGTTCEQTPGMGCEAIA